MSHEEHSHDTHSTEKKHKAPLSAAFWFTLVLVCLFIAALNFVNVMSNQEEGEGHGAHAEATHEMTTQHEGKHETTESADPATQAATEHSGTDTAAHSEAH